MDFRCVCCERDLRQTHRQTDTAAAFPEKETSVWVRVASRLQDEAMCLWIESVESGSRPLSRRLSCQRGQMPPRKLDNHQTHTTGVLAARDLAFLHHRLVTITFNFTRCVSHSTASHPPETDTLSFASFLRRRHDLSTAVHRQDLVSVDYRPAFVIPEHPHAQQTHLSAASCPTTFYSTDQ